MDLDTSKTETEDDPGENENFEFFSPTPIGPSETQDTDDSDTDDSPRQIRASSIEMNELGLSLATEISQIANAPDYQIFKRTDTPNEFEYQLDTIPTEMFLTICSFLDAGFLIRQMSLVCKKFYFILSNETTWRIRQQKRWGKNGAYPPVPVDVDEFCWSRACVKREEQIRLWGKREPEPVLREAELRTHIACVDSVHLYQGGELLVSGSRDRAIVVWNVEKCFSEDNPTNDGILLAPASSKVVHKAAAHKGWIWAFASTQSHILSASWDTTVRVWDKGTFDLVTEFKTRVACLCLSAMDNLVACGTFDRKVLFFDPRKGYEPITWYTAHRKPVLALGMDEKRVISCGEDGNIICYDIRAKKPMSKIRLNGTYPTCLSFRREDPAPLFYVGDKSGILHLIDSAKFENVKSYDIGHSRPIQGVFHGLGSVITCSRDGQLKILEPSYGLNELISHQVEAELPHVHSLYNIVALAGGDGIVRLWSPVRGF